MMDIENHPKVYLKDNVVVDASREAAKAYRTEMEVHMVANNLFKQDLEKGPQGPQEDQCMLRVGRLLDQLNEQEKRLLDKTDEVFDVCDKEQLRYVGWHPQLECLLREVRRAADFVDEFAKRVGLWLEHLRKSNAKVSDSVTINLAASISRQRDITTGLVWSAVMESPTGRIRPPGPGKLPYGVSLSLRHKYTADFR
jgi:hypothetical protein